MRVLVTGAAGFIGYFLSQRLLADGHDVVGLDNINDYYDPKLKWGRLDNLKPHANFTFHKLDLADQAGMEALFTSTQFDYVIHLAAQAGVRYSITNPRAYSSSNLVGFVNILEGCRHQQVKHLIYASSSSVYGANKKVPFALQDSVNHPVSLYAATKKANELMAHTYSHLYQLPTTGLRFFTVYGPWGRPDMAYFKFVKAIEAGQAIDVYNHGQMQRDFTYVDDVVEGIVRLMPHIPQGDANWDPRNPDPSSSYAPYKVYNIGNHSPVPLLRFIEVIEAALGKTATKNMLPMQPGDVPATYADVEALMQDVGFKPATSIEAGIGKFVDWYREYYCA